MSEEDENGIDIEVETEMPLSTAIAVFAIMCGVCCVAYEYVPIHGATPIALGLCILAFNAIGRWAARRRS